MKIRTIIIKVEIDDDDVIEQALFWNLEKLLGFSMKDFSKLPDTNDLYETDSTFRQLCTKVKAAKRYRDDYIKKIKDLQYNKK